MANFESVKRGFGTSEHTQTWTIPLGNVDDDVPNGIEDCELTIPMYASNRSFSPPAQSGVNKAHQRTDEPVF